jgi:hypothetical protein
VATPNVIKMDNNQNTTLMEQFQNSNIKIAERGKIDSPNTQTHDRSVIWLGTCTSIKVGGLI